MILASLIAILVAKAVANGPISFGFPRAAALGASRHRRKDALIYLQSKSKCTSQ
jgi:hypothetical protein